MILQRCQGQGAGNLSHSQQLRSSCRSSLCGPQTTYSYGPRLSCLTTLHVCPPLPPPPSLSWYPPALSMILRLRPTEASLGPTCLQRLFGTSKGMKKRAVVKVTGPVCDRYKMRGGDIYHRRPFSLGCSCSRE